MVNMGNKHFIIYTEGSLELGLGNVFRSIALADAIIRTTNDISVSFVTSSESYVRNIISNKHSLSFFGYTQEEVFEYIYKVSPHTVIIDYLGIAPKYTIELKNKNIKVALIGNNTIANHSANLVVNAIIGTDFINSEIIDTHGTKYLQGPKYLVLRDEFESKRDKYTYRSKLSNITLLFGGTDQADFSFRILSKLINEKCDFNIKLILGAGYKKRKNIDDFITEKELKSQVSILQNISNISEELMNTDFLITSPGTSLFEGLCLGIPSLAFFQNKSQEDVFRDFYRSEKFDPDKVLIPYITSLYEERASFKEKLSELKVGMGKDEIINNLIKI